MKVIETESFTKLAKSKYPKSETEPYNPWAVCNKSTGGKKEDPDKFERCVHHLKDQNKEKNKGEKKKKASEETKSVMEGVVFTPRNEDEYVEQSKGERFQRQQKGPRHPDFDPNMSAKDQDAAWLQLVNKMLKQQPEPAYANCSCEMKKE